MASTASAQNQEEFIPCTHSVQPLANVLDHFSEQSRIHILYRTELVIGRRSPVVRGPLGRDECLTKILRDSGLAYEFTSADTVVLRRGAKKNHAPQRQAEAPSLYPREESPEEIIVIGKRQASRLQRYAGSAAIFGPALLEQARVDGLEDIVRRISNASFEERPGGAINIAIRGSGTTTFTSANRTDTAIGLYYDGIYSYIQGSRIPLIFYDMERIEVLKGPQGGLYGRSAVGGAVIAQTAKPHENLISFARLEYGEHSSLKGEIHSNIPVSDKVFLRIAAYHDGRKSYYKNIDPAQKERGDYVSAGRLRLRLQPNEALDILLGYEYTHENRGPQILVPVRFGKDLISVSNTDGRTLRDTQRLISEINWYGIDGIELRSVTGYTAINSLASQDVNNLTPDGDGPAFFIGEESHKSNSYQFSQEFLALSEHSYPFEWLLGLSYFRDHQDIRSNFRTGFPSQLVRSFSDRRRSGLSMFAAFGDIKIPLSRKMTVGTSLRFSTEKRNIVEDEFSVTDSYNRLSPSASLTYLFKENMMIYAKFSSGYQSGGSNNSDVQNSETIFFGPSTVWNYETGIRTNWLNRRLFANVTLFRSDQNNYQLRLGDSLANEFANVGKARTDGAEVEITAHITNWLSIPFVWGYLDAHFRDAKDTIFGNLSGKRLLGVPKHTMSVGLNLHVNVTQTHRAYLRADYFRSSGGVALTINRSPGTQLTIPYVDHQILDIKTGIRAKGKYEIYFFAENILGEIYSISGQLDENFTPTSLLYSPPRVMGFGASLTF